jgi:hypothetical protein
MAHINYRKLDSYLRKRTNVVQDAVIEYIQPEWIADHYTVGLCVPADIVQEGKPTGARVPNIFGGRYVVTDMGPILVLLMRLLVEAPEVYKNRLFSEFRNIPCRLISNFSEPFATTVAIGHPTKDYFLDMRDLIDIREEDTIPEFVWLLD